MQLNLKYFFSFFLLIVSFQLEAQVQFEMSVSAKEIGKRDELQVEYVISGADKISNFQFPYFEKWTIMSGPSNSTEIYNVNGKRSSTYKYIYVVSPTTTGKLNVPGASITADGKNYSCKALVVTVKKNDHVDGAGPAPSYAPPQVDLSIDEGDVTEDFKEYDLRPGEDPVKKIRSNLFVKAIASKRKCYVGEPVMVTYKLYTRLKSNSRVVKQPSFTGCSVSEMTTNDMRAVVETVNGKKYNTYVFRRVQLFPLQPGRMTATMASVDNTVTFTTGGGSDLRKLYYGLNAGEDYNLVLSTEPVSIEVMPLPGNKNASVGHFEVFTRLKKDTIAANETNSLLVSIVGRGNFKSVTQPEIEWPDSIYHFDVTESEEIDKLSFPLTGRRTYEIPFEVNKAGKISFAPVSFSYFDPSKGTYKTAQSSPLQLTVTPALKTGIQRSALTTSEEGMKISYLLFLLPVVFLIGAIIIWKKPKKKVQPVVEFKATEKAPAPVVKFNVKDKMDELIFIQDDTAFYSKARELAKDLIGIGKGDQDLLLQVLQDCNTVLYTPIPSTSRKEILEKLQRAIV